MWTLQTGFSPPVTDQQSGLLVERSFLCRLSRMADNDNDPETPTATPTAEGLTAKERQAAEKHATKAGLQIPAGPGEPLPSSHAADIYSSNAERFATASPRHCCQVSFNNSSGSFKGSKWQQLQVPARHQQASLSHESSNEMTGSHMCCLHLHRAAC